MMSALYEGRVEHHRHGPREHRFGYGLILVYLDLAELDDVFHGRWLWSTSRPNLVWLRRADYLGQGELPLDEAVRRRVEAELGDRPRGAVRVLTQLRTVGYVFNPVSFYYCFDEPDSEGRERLHSIVAEITNTPWKERHAYVLRASGDDGPQDWQFDKAFHVSPFFDMQQRYGWSFSPPSEKLTVRMHNEEAGRTVFDVRLDLQRQPIGAYSLARALLRHPLLTLRVPLAIYWQALLLWVKRTPFFVHPSKRPSPEPS